jgi:hypothetical protein
LVGFADRAFASRINLHAKVNVRDLPGGRFYQAPPWRPSPVTTKQIEAGSTIHVKWVSLLARERAGITLGEPLINQLNFGLEGPIET